MDRTIRFFPFRRTVRHPFFPEVAADPAARAWGQSQALAGTFRELSGAAARGAKARRAVYVMTTEGEPLSDGQREELWRLFQVPIYALLTRGGRLKGWECEAQNGLHVAGGGAEIRCACGRPGATVMAAETITNAAA
jgi:hypothetical protein